MIKPNIDGTKILNKKIVIAERNPTSAGNPIAETKNIEALSLIPKSPKDMDGINDLTKRVNIPQRRNAISKGLLANADISIPYCKAIKKYKKKEKESCTKTILLFNPFNT